MSSSGDLKFNLASEGNGTSYDGKLEGFARLVPDFTCEGQSAAFASFELNQGNATLFSGCHEKNQIPISDLELSKLSDNYLVYQNGLYTYSKDVQADLRRGAFTEAWCQAREGDQTSDPSFEIGIHWEQAGQKALSRIYTANNKTAAEVSVERRIEIEKVYYASSTSQLSIQFKSQTPGSGSFPGVYQGLIGSTKVSVPVQCWMGGQFDSVAPQLNYPENFYTLVLGQPLPNMNPRLNKTSARFSVSPELPSGLDFNASTGEISGVPTELRPRKSYLITAVFIFGEVSRAISIGVGREFSGEGTCAKGTCDLVQLIEQANQIGPVPAVINVEGTQIWGGREILISGDVEIRGTNAVFDAQGLSRHFSVLPKAVLSLSGVTLKNGVASAGGSIYAESALLNLRHTHFENNQAVAGMYGSGGAVLIKQGRLSVTDSSFVDNRTSWNGGNLFGGAISAEGVSGFSISRSEFKGNSSAGGGAIYLFSGSSDVFEITDVFLSGNSAFDGGGIKLRSGRVSVTNSFFDGNRALIQGGGINIFWTDRVWLDNNRFLKNSADRGSAISYSFFSKSSQLYILNSEIKDNVLNPATLARFSSIRGSAFIFDGPVVISDSTFNNASPSLSNCGLTFPGSPQNKLTSLGNNIFDDTSCEAE